MDRNLCSLDLNTLKSLYEKASSELSDALLNGVEWKETREKRQKVTDLAIEIHKKRFAPNTNPAEQSSRKDESAP